MNAGEPRTLRDEGWAFAQKASDHQRGYEAGKRDALAGHFDPCATCGHERIAHYDGGNCGEEDCPQNCAAFVPKEAEAVRVYRDALRAWVRESRIAGDGVTVTTEMHLFADNIRANRPDFRGWAETIDRWAGRVEAAVLALLDGSAQPEGGER